jgi:hypothetical protein
MVALNQQEKNNDKERQASWTVRDGDASDWNSVVAALFPDHRPVPIPRSCRSANWTTPDTRKRSRRPSQGASARLLRSGSGRSRRSGGSLWCVSSWCCLRVLSVPTLLLTFAHGSPFPTCDGEPLSASQRRRGSEARPSADDAHQRSDISIARLYPNHDHDDDRRGDHDETLACLRCTLALLAVLGNQCKCRRRMRCRLVSGFPWPLSFPSNPNACEPGLRGRLHLAQWTMSPERWK